MLCQCLQKLLLELYRTDSAKCSQVLVQMTSEGLLSTIINRREEFVHLPTYSFQKCLNYNILLISTECKRMQNSLYGYFPSELLRWIQRLSSCYSSVMFCMRRTHQRFHSLNGCTRQSQISNVRGNQVYTYTCKRNRLICVKYASIVTYGYIDGMHPEA